MVAGSSNNVINFEMQHSDFGEFLAKKRRLFIEKLNVKPLKQPGYTGNSGNTVKTGHPGELDRPVIADRAGKKGLSTLFAQLQLPLQQQQQQQQQEPPPPQQQQKPPPPPPQQHQQKPKQQQQPQQPHSSSPPTTPITTTKQRHYSVPQQFIPCLVFMLRFFLLANN